MKVAFCCRCASVLLLLTLISSSVAAQGQDPPQASTATVQDQMNELARELHAIREENQQLKDRLARLEEKETAAPAPTPPPPPPPAKALAESGPPPWANLMKNFTPFGEVGIRWQALFNHDSLPGQTNYYNRPEGLLRLGMRGQITSRLSYVLRLSTGVSTEGGDPWIAYADPGDRRFIGLDEYYLTWQPIATKTTNSFMFGGKLANVPAALGTTELLVDKDFGLHLFANLSTYTLTPTDTVSLLSSVGFVTNQGAVTGRSLQPVVSSPPGTLAPSGLINDINQYGPPRANAYVAELAENHTVSSSTKLRGSFALINISHPNDVPLFLGATGLLGIDGLRLPNMPQGTSTNLPGILPLDANGIVKITGNDLATNLVLHGDASAFRILDTFGSVTLHADKKYPVRFYLDWARNLAAGAFIPGPASGNDISTPAGLKNLAMHRRDGYVLGFDLGTESAVKQHFFSYKFVLIGSDTTLTYVNNDQWHTNIRGHDFTWQYRLTPNVAPFFTLMVAQNMDARLIGFSSLARYPVSDLLPGMDLWMFRPRAGILVTF